MLSEGNGNRPSGNGNQPDGGGHGSSPQSNGPSGVGIHWENLMSLRYWFGALFGALAFAFAISLAASLIKFDLPESAIEVCFFLYLGIALVGGLAGRRYWCPHCRGMVKAGATVCRHCGRSFDV